MKIKYEKQIAVHSISPSAGACEINQLTEMPEVYPGDAILPRSVGYFLGGGGAISATAAGYTMFMLGLVTIDQDAPSVIFRAKRLCGLRGYSKPCALSQADLPEFMGPQDMEPLPAGLEVFPSLGYVGLVTQYHNLTIAGALSIYVIVGYDIVTLTTAEQARLGYGV